MAKKGKKNVPPLKSFSIENFRGISDKREIIFDKVENIVVLVGENGTGKSSFVNAFEYMFKDNIDITSNKTLKAAGPIVHSGVKKDGLKIEMNFSNNYLRKNFNEPFQCDKGMRHFVYNPFVKNASFILNRSKILNFIDTGNTARYDNLMKLSISKDYSELKDALSKTRYSFNSSYGEIQKKLEKKYADILDVLEITDYEAYDKERNNLEYLLIQVNEMLVSINKKPISKETDLEKYREELNYSEEDIIIKNDIQKFNDSFELIDFDKIDSSFSNILGEYEHLSNQSNKILKLQKSIFTGAKDYFNMTSSKECPICGNIIDSDVMENLNSNLDTLNETLSSLNKWDADYKSFLGELKNLKSNLIDIKNHLNHFENELIATDEIIIQTENLITDMEKLNDFEILLSDLKGKYDFNRFKSNLDNIHMDLNDYLSELSSVEKSLLIKKLKDALFRLEEYELLEVEKEKINKKLEFTDYLFRKFEDTKIEYVNSIMDRIWQKTEDYYNIIHGDDPIKSPKVEVKGASKIALYLNAFGKEGDPRDFASEGHLDSLGICIFLAFNKEFNPLKFMILDDILTTVDLSHKHQIARLIIENFNDFRILITTHNGLWVEQLQKIASANKTNIKTLEIIDWNLHDGPIIRQKENFQEKVNRYLEDADYNAAGNTARRYLENMLYDFSTNEQNKVYVPLREKYMVGDLYEPVHQRLNELSEGKNWNEYNNYVWNELGISCFIGNKLSHENKDSYFLYGTDVIPFCNIVGELNKLLNCVNCKYKGDLVFDKDTHEIHCSEFCKHINIIYKDKSEIKRENIEQVF